MKIDLKKLSLILGILAVLFSVGIGIFKIYSLPEELSAAVTNLKKENYENAKKLEIHESEIKNLTSDLSYIKGNTEILKDDLKEIKNILMTKK